MPWLVGIDEAGYGPNLGPFVMTSVACRVPDRQADCDLWETLKPAVRRHPEPDDGRPVVADSKLVYSTGRGLLGLERNLAATLACARFTPDLTLAGYIDWAAPAAHPPLRQEPWYAGTSSLPVLARPEDFLVAAERFQHTCAGEQIAWGLIRSIVICPAEFNRILERWDTKGAVLGHGLAELLATNCAANGADEPLWFTVDKHGGRNTYAAMIQNGLPGGMVVAQEEGRERSTYRVHGLKCDIRLTFQPRADAEHFCVALASMFSKYLREVLMREFNQFWQTQVPGLKPTAGYPGDALRFLEQIRPAARQLGIDERVLWRCR